MKKVFLWIFIFTILFLCIKSSLNFGQKETIIDIMNTKSEKTEDFIINENIQDSYYTSIEPIQIESYIFDEKLINSQIVLLNENSNFDNEEFLNKKENFNFDKNTYILINCSSKKNIDIKENQLIRNNLSFIFTYNEDISSNQTLLLEIKNIKVNNMNYFNFEWKKEVYTN